MIYVTGDTHGDMNYFRPGPCCRDEKLVSGDQLIITGDFGFVMSGDAAQERKLEELTGKPYEILFVDGNHENFDLLEQYPREDRWGGEVRRIRDNIFWLQRGRVYTIGGKTFFALGGAASVDKAWKLAEGKWWPRELPGEEELALAERNLTAHSNCVDYILTHTAPNRHIFRLLGKMPGVGNDDYALTCFLEDRIYRKVRFRKWFFGHFHQDRTFYDGLVACMDQVHPVE